IRQILENVNLDIYEDDGVYITGSNGSGKSTLLNAIAGIDPARIVGGSITFKGIDITQTPAHVRAQFGIGYLRQRDNVFGDLTVGENLRLALGSGSYTRFQNAYPEMVTALPVDKRVSLLSGGQKQRLAWAMTTLRLNQLLLADEPEAGLSQELQLPDSGTFLMVTHSSKNLVWRSYETHSST
ncbi:MAG: ATP-binding cassette domain-containing protein, partial [Acidobacteria bacterium]|nr:ATP-binding cassette domain-containing protein [Acidobacteriota bacterium]MCA1638193.1 ATP-binding cassette domain-containing protein [Acidobacteriota bacterium]